MAGKRMKAFKKQHEDEPDPDDLDNDDDLEQMAIRRTKDKRGPIFSGKGLFWRIPVDARLGGGGCRGENRP